MGGNVFFKTKSGSILDASPIDLRVFDRCHARIGIKRKLDQFIGTSGNYVTSGSATHLFDPKISDYDMWLHKAVIGDIDVLVSERTLETLRLWAEREYFDDICEGGFYANEAKCHGKTIHVLMRHPAKNQNVQFDFTGVPWKHIIPEDFYSFSHSSDWEDTKLGIKGAHHKILLNACGGKRYKFSIMHGLGLRDGDDPKWITNLVEINLALFPNSPYRLSSFVGLVKSIKESRSTTIFEIVNKFMNDLNGKHKKLVGNDAAINYLTGELLQ